MSKTKRGKRDGTGPHKDSWQYQQKKRGSRQLAGVKCPKRK